MPDNRFADTGTSRIAYELHGQRSRRKPWLVLVMGLGFDRTGWVPVVPALGRRFRLVLIDNRGVGRSTTADRRFAVADLADDVVAVLDSSRITDAHVLGVSLGGMVAQELAIRHPERVDRLVLACTTPGWPYGYPMPRASLRAALRLPVEGAQRRMVENALSPGTLRAHPELVERIISNQAAQQAGQAAWEPLVRAGATYSGGARQSRIKAPTLVICGDADSVVDPRNSKLLASRIPDVRTVIFPGLGHLFFWEDPDRFAQVVTSFLVSGDGRPPRRRGWRGRTRSWRCPCRRR